MHYVEKDRPIVVKTPLGENKLLLLAFSGIESISGLFSFDLELMSEDGNIKFEDIIGKNVTVSVELVDKKKRFWNGIVSRFTMSDIDQDSHLFHYRAKVVPWLWLLTRCADCRIFQDKTAVDIIKAVFDKHGLSDYKDETQGSFVQREYCVQYRETDFEFVSRLMEEEGIFYFFRHEEGRHTLVLANQSSAHKECPYQSKARYDLVANSFENEDVVTFAVEEQELRSGKYAQTDYNFKQPNTNLMVNTNSTINIGGNSKYEVYDYPSEYEKKGDGESLVKIRMQEIEADSKILRGRSTCRAFIPGFRFTLQEHPRQALNGSYVITDLHVMASAAAGFKTGEEGEDTYTNQFTAIPFSQPYRPERGTERPRIDGPHTAVVVGPSGEEIYTDKYGRVKVHFFWDREGKKDGNDTMWCRVSQAWAGKGWGAMWIPRIGQEVIVEFIESDPDHPIITGRVYNDDQMPPYKLPDHMTVSTFRSHSSKGGGDSNFNELRFEDKKGSEQVFIQAEKDMDVNVKNDKREWVGHDYHLMIKHDQVENVKNDKHVYVVNNQSEKVDQKKSVKVGMDYHEKAGMSYALDAGTTIHIKAGVAAVIEAGTQLTLKVGASFIDLSPATIAISSPMVLINSGGAAGAGAGSSPDSPKAPDEADDATKFTKR